MTEETAVRTRPGYLLVTPWNLQSAGGVSQVVRNLRRELAAAGWSPTVLVLDWNARSPRLERHGDVQVLRWRVRPLWVPGGAAKALVAFVAAFPRVAWTFRRLARRHGWRVINVHFPTLSALTWILLRSLRCWRGVVVMSTHGGEVRGAIAGGDRWRQRVMRATLEHADRVVACSTELAREAARLAPGAAQHVSVIANGVSAARLMAERDEEFRLDDALSRRRLIVNVATFEHRKAQDVLLAAFARVAARFPDVDLVLAGRPTAWLHTLKQQVSAAGATDRVRFFVNLPHGCIPTLLSHASVFCLPSHFEGQPLALLEAASMGVPVVATAVGGVPEIVPDDSYGLLVPAGEVEPLARALTRLLAEPDHASALGRRLQGRVERDFTWAAVARRYTELARRHGVLAGGRAEGS